MDLLLGPQNSPMGIRDLVSSFRSGTRISPAQNPVPQWPLRTGGPECSSAAPAIETVAQGTASAAVFDVWVRDPASFIAGEPHRHLDVWDRLSHRHPQKELIREWIRNGISVRRFITPLKGQCRQETFNHIFPPNRYYPKNKKCKFHKDVISREIETKIAKGAIKVWGMVEDTPPPPAIVTPLSIEPSKPRLVHDQQYLNCFMQQCPFCSIRWSAFPATYRFTPWEMFSSSYTASHFSWPPH